MKKQYIDTGVIVGTHGLRGEMRVQPWSDSPTFLTTFDTMYLDEQGRQPLRVRSARVHKNIVLLTAEGIGSIEEAERLRGKVLYVNRKDIALESGRHFVQDLIGCEVSDADTGERYGELTDVISTGANDVWQVTDAQGKDYLVPVIPDVVVSVDIDAERITLRPLGGIFDED